jgi:hypothetical protein
MNKHLWEIEHPYYCEEGCHFHTQEKHQTIWPFASWADYIADMGSSDMDFNLLFRWDWREDEDWADGSSKFNGDVNYRNGRLYLFVMHQRKGYKSTGVVEVCRADEHAVIEFLKPRLAHLMNLWAPLTSTGELT